MAYRIRHPRKASLLEAARPSGSKSVSGVAYFRFSNLSPTWEIICTRREYTTTADDAPVQYLLSLKRQEKKKQIPPKKRNNPKSPTFTRRKAAFSNSPGKSASLTISIKRVTYTAIARRQATMKKACVPASLLRLCGTDSKYAIEPLSTYLAIRRLDRSMMKTPGNAVNSMPYK